MKINENENNWIYFDMNFIRKRDCMPICGGGGGGGGGDTLFTGYYLSIFTYGHQRKFFSKPFTNGLGWGNSLEPKLVHTFYLLIALSKHFTHSRRGSALRHRVFMQKLSSFTWFHSKVQYI